MKVLLICAFVLFSSLTRLHAQQFRLDTTNLHALNQQRITTNQKGMVVLGTWAAANIVTGAAGAIIAKDEEWKAFHGMNAAWNVVNGVIAAGGYFGARRERSRALSCPDMLRRYESNKRLYLINGGLDLLYIGSGAFLMEHSMTLSEPKMWRGFGKSVLLQGAFLLMFDATMYASHQSKEKNWYKLLQGICYTPEGIGFRYTLN